MALLEASGIGKDFGETHVLKDISLTLEQGEALAIIGSSGSGKTTLLRCLNFLERPDTGVIKVNGETMWDAADPATQRESEVRKKRLHFGLVFQNFNLFPQYTALQNVMLAGELLAKERPDYKVNKKAIHAQLEQQARELLAQMGLSERAGHYPHQLSGGQQQRVAIARALATDPKVLLCDEATSALDPKTTRQILELIRDINQKLNITVVIITHQMSVVKEVCSHVAILDDGCVAESGMVGTVFAAPKSEAGRRLVFPGGADAQVYNPQDEKLVRLVFRDSKTTSIPLIARLAAEEGVFCNVISASTQKLSETVYGSMMLGIPSAQYDKAVAFIHNVANVQVEEVDHHVQ